MFSEGRPGLECQGRSAFRRRAHCAFFATFCSIRDDGPSVCPSFALLLVQDAFRDVLAGIRNPSGSRVAAPIDYCSATSGKQSTRFIEREPMRYADPVRVFLNFSLLIMTSVSSKL